ncbi:MAG: flagellar hook-length control protein FliK [Burkholderiales bacterium]
MKLIVYNALAFPNCEAPAASPDIKPIKDGAEPEIKGPGFAQELKDCEAPPKEPYKPSADKAQPLNEEKGDKEVKDNGMPDIPGAEGAVYGIVGILEGFEPPSYQSDNAACMVAENIIPIGQQTAAQSEGAAMQIQLPQQKVQEKAAPPENQQAIGQNTGETSEQTAWMLQNNDAGTKPVQTQDEILRIVGDYLDSLENTNSQASGKAGAESVLQPAAEAGAESVLQPAAEAGAESILQPAAEADTAVSPKAAESLKTQPQVQAELQSEEPVAAKEAKDAAGISTVKQGLSDNKPTEAEAPDSKVLNMDTGKPESRIAAEPVNGAAANAEPAVNKAEAQQPEPANTQARPEAVRESVLKIVDRVKTGALEGKYDFDIDLKPEFMGKVSIKLTMEDGNIKVQIKAEEASVKAMLSDQSSNLHYMLKEKGIPVTTVDIAYSDTMTGHESAGESAGQYERRNSQGSVAYEQATEGTFDTAKERYDFYLGGSNVEYLA